jgi:hypothetical protein
MRLRFHLLVVTAAVVALTFFAAGTSAAAGPRLDRAAVLPAMPAAGSAAFAVHCERPATLRLIRFEDGSAQLRCGRRLLVRVSVPG